MKKIFIFLTAIAALVIPHLSFAYLYGQVTISEQRCFVDEYAVIYMNGVLNTETDAELGRYELRRLLAWNDLLEFKGHRVVVYKAFNPSHIAGLGDSLKVALQKAYDQAQNTLGLDFDAKEMVNQMHDEVKEGRILFVPHSQGNFYANSIYDWLATREGGIATSSMAMYNVASPAQMYTRNARYILSKNDKVIAGLVGAVGNIAPPNVEFPVVGPSGDELGHNFVDTYLRFGSERMAKDIKAQLAALEVDTAKDPVFACVPDADTGVAHFLLSAYYDLVDPVTVVVRDTVADLAGFAYFLTGSVFSSERTVPDGSIVGTQNLPNLSSSTPTFAPFVPSNEFPVISSAPVAREEVTIEKPKVVKTPKVDPDAELKLALLERIAYLKRLIKTETKLEAQEVASAVIRRGGGLPTARAHALDEASTTPVIEIPALGFTVEDNLPESHKDDAVEPTNGHLLITEYYIGKGEEASWVELMNTTDKWLDMRNTEFVENDERTAFPLTGIPPKKFVVLKSGGMMAHAILQSEAPYRMIAGLRSGVRTSGEFVVLASHNLVDRAPYGPGYCDNPHALRRSCERMVTAFPGDRPEYWVRARALETPTQYENASTIGYENQSWGYHIYEGRLITGTYPGEVLPRGNYVTGTITIQSGEELRVDNAHPWMLAIPDAAIFGGAGQTVVHVYGTLNIWKTGAIRVNKLFADYDRLSSKPVVETIPYILVHEGGLLVRDPYSFLTAPVVIRGGVVRTNTLSSRMRIESGKLYLTYYNDGTSPSQMPSCDEYRDPWMALEWLGGKVYRAGVDCGSWLYAVGDEEGTPYIGPNDPFGVLALANAEDCRIYYAARNVSDCSEYFGLPPGTLDPPPWLEPPVVAGTSTTATSSPGVGENSTSTPQITTGDGNATSTASSTPPVGDSGTGTSTASTTIPMSGDVSTTTASSTPPVGESSTSTPPSSDNGTGTSTASTTVPIGGDGTSTSTASSTPSGGSGAGEATTTPGVFCYEGPTYYDGITLEELNSTCGHGWAPRPTLFPVTTWGRNPFEERMQITEYYIGAEGEASWFKFSNMMGFAPIDLGVTDIFLGESRVPFPVLSIPARQFVIVQSAGALARAIPTISMNGGVQATMEYSAIILPALAGSSGDIRINYTTSPRFSGVDAETLHFERGVCPGVVSTIGSCVLIRPYMIGNYPGDAGYVPWSMPESPVASSNMFAVPIEVDREVGGTELPAATKESTLIINGEGMGSEVVLNGESPLPLPEIIPPSTVENPPGVVAESDQIPTRRALRHPQ